MDNAGKKPPTLPQTCAVCGETSHQVAIHYSRLLCNGCRAFFKRTVQGKMKLSDCKLRGECKVNPASRKDCKPCRFTACLKAGVDVNKVQPARDTSAESSSRERHTDANEDALGRIQSRMETAPPLFPDHFQYPLHPHPHPHPYHAYPHLSSSILPPPPPPGYEPTSSIHLLPPPPAAAKLYPVSFFAPPTNLYYHHPLHTTTDNNPRHHLPPYLTTTTTTTDSLAQQNVCVGSDGVVIFPTPSPTTTTTTANYDSFNLNHYTNTHTNTIRKSNNSSSLYPHPQFPTPSTHQITPYVGPYNTQTTTATSTTHANDTETHSNQAQDIKFPPHQRNHNDIPNLTHYPHPETSVPASSIAKTSSIYSQTQNAPTNHSIFDFRHNVKPFSRYDLTPRAKGNNPTTSESATPSSTIPFPVPIYAGYGPAHASIQMPAFFQYNNYLTLPSKPNENQSSQKSSAFMIDTLLDQQPTNTNANTLTTTPSSSSTANSLSVSNRNTHNPQTTHPTTDHQPMNITVKQEHFDQNENDHVTIIAEPESTTDVHTTTPQYPIREDNDKDSSSTCLDIHVVDKLKQEASSSHRHEFSQVVSPIHNHVDDSADDENDDNDDGDDIFLHPLVQLQPTTNESKNSNVTAAPEPNNRVVSFGISRDRLTSTPNRKKHPSCDSPEVEVDVDVINTPSPINANYETSMCSSNGSDDDDAGGHGEDELGSQKKSDEILLRNTQKIESNSILQTDDKITSAPESSSEENSEGISDDISDDNTENVSCKNVRRDKTTSFDGVVERCTPEGASQNVSSRVESDDSGVESRCHSYNKSSLTSTPSSSSSSSSTSSVSTSNIKSHSNNNITSSTESESAMSFKTEIIGSSSLEQDRGDCHEPSDVSRIATDNSQSDSSSGVSSIYSNTSNTNDNSECNSHESTSNLTSDDRNVSSSESRGSCRSVPLKRSTPRKWKRFSSNENLPLQSTTKGANSPKRVRCASPDVSNPIRLNTSDAMTQQTNKEDEHFTTEKQQQSISCRERLGEIQNVQNALQNDTNNRADAECKKGDNRVNVDTHEAEKSSLPGISSFLDSIIQRIRNAESDVEVMKAKQELETFYRNPSEFK